MKKKILLIAGGYSNEREISLQTAKSVYFELKKNKKYNLKIIEPDGNFVKNLRLFKPKVVLNLLHGRYGEDGYIQSILESEKINMHFSSPSKAAIIKPDEDTSEGESILMLVMPVMLNPN